MSEPTFGGGFQEIAEIRYYTGGEKCQYQCGSMAEFVVVGKTGTEKHTFAGCQPCLNKASIYPVENGWVDERDYFEKRRNA